MSEEKSKITFSKNDTWTMKGFAIIFLCCYHCFSDYFRLSGVDVNFFPFSQKIGMYICESLNMCVGMFAFLSVYGMTLSVKNKYRRLKLKRKEWLQFSISRYIGLLGGFLIPFIFCQLGCLVMGKYCYGHGIVETICNFILDMFGLSMFFKTTMLTTTWWYMSLAVLFIFLFPIVVGMYERYGCLIIIMIALMLQLWVRQIDNMSRWLFVIPLGIVFADLNLFQIAYEWIRKKQEFIWLKRVFIYILFLGLVYLRPHPWGLAHIKLLINSIIPVFMIFILYDIFHNMDTGRKIFVFLGKHSANIFYIHTFIRSVWFNKVTYSFRFAAIILIFLLFITVLISVCLEFLKQKIYWNQKIIFLKNRCNQRINEFF